MRCGINVKIYDSEEARKRQGAGRRVGEFLDRRKIKVSGE
jgi:hypothetical protein